MRIYLDCIEGPHKGQKYSLSEKTSFGRKEADVLLNDPKLSGIHAYFEFSEDSGWSVVDNKSRNGVWVNGLKESRMVLKDGDLILFGSTKFVVRLLEAGAFQFSEKFQVWVQALYKKLVNAQPAIQEVKPELRLKVVQGIQYGQTWSIFYGPRKAGRESTDICLYDEKAPRNSFEIQVKGKYAYFYTENEAVVRINNRSVKEKQFTPGDVISFGDSQILVEIDEGHGFGN